MKKRLLPALVSLTLLVSTSTVFASSNIDIPTYTSSTTSELVEILQVPIGLEESQVGYIPAGNETLDQGPTSFTVKNGVIFILDNVNKKMLINQNGQYSSFPLSDVVWGKDVVVSDDQTIYILDSADRTVLSYDFNGSLLTSYTIPETVSVPSQLSIDSSGIYVKDFGASYTQIVSSNNRSLAASLDVSEATPIKLDETTGLIDLSPNNGRAVVTNTSIKVPYNHSFGELKVLNASNQGVLITKTEVAPNIPVVVAESHINLLDFDGNVKGEVRIPLEKMTFVPDHYVKVDQNNIYVMTVESSDVFIYKAILGSNHVSKMDQLIDQKMLSSKGELEKFSANDELHEITPYGSTGVNGFIHRSTALSRASDMINYKWTVKSGNIASSGGSTVPSYISNKAIGSSIIGIPYKWGGADGATEGSGGRGTFGSYQSAGKPTGDVNTSHSPVPAVTGIDCSGFVGNSWYRVDDKYGTSTLYKISTNITKANLQKADALNASGFHTVLYLSSTTDGISTREATTDNGGKAQNYSRTWTWLNNKNFTYIKYNRIVDDGLPLPQPN